MKEKFSARRLCRAGVIAALYVALSYLVQPFAFGAVQMRLSEALTVLPLFFIESVPALFVGCLLTNLGGLGVYDIIIGSLTTLLAAICTYFTGKLIKNKYLKFFIGILFPIIFNAFAVPWVLLLSGVEIQGYFIETLIIGAGELGAVGIFGGILYFSTYRLFALKGDDKT